MNHTIRVALVRGAYMNAFEGQNYRFDSGIQITGISSHHPLTEDVGFPLIRLPSITDMPFMSVPLFTRVTKILANRTLGDMQILFGLERLANSFDIFHTADSHYYYSYQLARMRKAGMVKRLVMTSWETMPFRNESVARKKSLKYAAMEPVDVFVCYTQKAADTLIAEGIPASRIQIVPLGVDLTRFTPSIRNPHAPVTILFVGRLVEEKGIKDLYHAFQRTSTGNISMLRLVGSGPLEGWLRRQAQADGLSDRIRIEPSSYATIERIYHKSDMFVLPSRHTDTWEEQYGMVLAEAMGCGLAVIATSTGAIPEVVGDAGILVPERDPDSIADAIMSIMNPKERSHWGTKARAHALDRLDSTKTNKKIGRIYQDLYL